MSDNYFETAKPGEMAVRRCGCYFEYCDGCCNSCTRCRFTTSDHTIMLSTLGTSNGSVPDASLYESGISGTRFIER